MQIKETFKYTGKGQFELIELPYGYETIPCRSSSLNRDNSANDMTKLLNPAELENWSESLWQPEDFRVFTQN
jgi:serine protease inhibitor